MDDFNLCTICWLGFTSKFLINHITWFFIQAFYVLIPASNTQEAYMCVCAQWVSIYVFKGSFSSLSLLRPSCQSVGCVQPPLLYIDAATAKHVSKPDMALELIAKAEKWKWERWSTSRWHIFISWLLILGFGSQVFHSDSQIWGFESQCIRLWSDAILLHHILRS